MKHIYYFGLILFFILSAVCTKSIAQKQGQEKIDSLQAALTSYKSPCNEPCLKDSNKVNLLNKIAWEFKFIAPDSAMHYSKRALAYSEKINWQYGIGDSYHNIASVYYNKGENYTSVEMYHKAIDIWNDLEKKSSGEEKKNILLKKSKSLGNLGAVLDALNKSSEALECYLEALEIDEKQNNKDGIATKLGKLGTFYYNQNDFKKSLDYLTKSLEMDKELNNKKRIGANLGNLGLTYWKMGDSKQAMKCYQEAVQINEAVGNKNYVAVNYTNIAILFDEAKEYTKANEYYFKALEIKKAQDDKDGIANLLANIGSKYQDQGDYRNAEKYLIIASELADSVHAFIPLRDAFLNLSRLYEVKGDFKKSLSYYRKATAIKDSLFNEEKTQEITSQEKNYEFDKKESTTKAEQDKKDAIAEEELKKQKVIRNSIAAGSGIILLSGLLIFFSYKRKRDAEQKQKETSLSLQVSETEMKALRSQMNPHFIFNALQSIQTFLLSHKSEEANTYLLKFSKLMRAVLENSQHSEVSFKEDLQALELYMQLESIRLAHPFTYQFHIDDSVDMENDSIPPLILQPFVENAIWHGLQYKSEAGHINIFITKEDNALHMTVEDNGVGRDMSKKVAQPMLLKKESLGMKLTEERLKILNEVKKTNAKFSITDLFTKDNLPLGTKVELSMPLVA